LKNSDNLKDRANFVYYLKELEFRYNYRDNNIEDNLYVCLCEIKSQLKINV